MFWGVHDAVKAVVIGLTDERYARLVVGTTGEGREPLASHKALVEAYIDGFRRSDHEAILETFHINLGGPGAGSG